MRRRNHISTLYRGWPERQNGRGSAGSALGRVELAAAFVLTACVNALQIAPYSSQVDKSVENSEDGALLDELKRRKVVRAALVYGAAAFAVLQVGDIVVGPLAFPPGS